MGIVTKYPSKGASRRIAVSGIMALAGRIINALKGIVLVPLYITVWGKTLYGEWLTLFAVISYIPLINVGMHTYVNNYLTRLYGEGDFKKYNIVFQSALKLFSIILFGGGVIVFLAVTAMPIGKMLNIVTVNTFTVKYTLYLLGAYVLIIIFFNLLVGWYRSVGELAKGIMAKNIMELVTFVFILITIFFRGGFIKIASVYFFTALTTSIYCVLDFKLRHKDIKLSFSQADLGIAKSFFAPGFLFCFFAVSRLLVFQGSIIVISKIFGPDAVSAFTVHRLMFFMIMIIIASFDSIISPEIIVFEARKEYDRLRGIVLFFAKVSLFISCSSVVFLNVSGRNMVEYFSRGTIAYNPGLSLVLSLYICVFTFLNSVGLVQLVTNRHKKYSLLRVSSAILSLILAGIFGKIYGLVGVMVGIVIPELFLCFIVPIESLRIIKVNVLEFFKKVVLKAFPFLIALSTVGYLLRLIKINMYVDLAISACGISVAAIVLGYLFWLEKTESVQIEKMVLRFARQFKRDN